MIQKSPKVSRFSGEETWRRHQVRQWGTVRWPRYQHTVPRSMVQPEFTITKIPPRGGKSISQTFQTLVEWDYNCIIMWTATMILTYKLWCFGRGVLLQLQTSQTQDEKREAVSENWKWCHFTSGAGGSHFWNQANIQVISPILGGSRWFGTKVKRSPVSQSAKIWGKKKAPLIPMDF